MSGDTPCRILPGDAQPCRLPTGELFRSKQLVKNKSMIAVTGVERFHCEEENTYEGNALKPS